MGAWRIPEARRLAKGGTVLLLVCVSLSACFYPQTTEPGVVGEKGPKASRAFVHKVHEEVLKRDEFKCTDCHLYDLAYLSRNREINEQVARVLTRAGAESCHFCHRYHPEKTKVALKCLDCHADIRPIRPANHRAGWRDSHGINVNGNDVACSQCHSNRFCVRCHTRRDQADRAYHTGSALLSHPIEARADPVRCQKCHQISWCTRCHKSGRF